MGDYTPQRTAYPFSLYPTRYRTRSETQKLQTQWNTFERVENYDDVIYQKFQKGIRNETYYLFVSDQERNDYRVGQQLHRNVIINVPPSTFDSIRNRPMPNVPLITSLPYVTSTEPRVPQKYVPTASEQAAINSDLTIYVNISTYNQQHVIKYAFVSDEEKTAYLRALNRINGTTTA